MRCVNEDSCDANEDRKVEYMKEKLQKSGFGSIKSVNALVATGFVNEGKAAKWLVSHVNDLDIETDMRRVFQVFLCPLGSLADAVNRFWERCRDILGWTAAFESMPHITLLPSFEVESSKVLSIHKIFASLSRIYIPQFGTVKVPLELRVEDNFVGYIVTSPVRDMLETFTRRAIKELMKAGFCFTDETLSKLRGIYHVSLAYNYPSHLAKELDAVREEIFTEELLKEECEWELRLYSKDGRLYSENDIETYEMRWCSNQLSITNHPVDLQESYLPGHRICMFPSLTQKSSLYQTGILKRHFAKGMNMNTGEICQFSPLLGERIPQWWTWTLHRAWNIHNTRTSSYVEGDVTFAACRNTIFPTSALHCQREKPVVIAPESGHKKKNFHRILIMRHGERMDDRFGEEWISHCFDNDGVYKRVNLNMPITLPSRLHSSTFAKDPPLTLTGNWNAFETGRCLAQEGIFFTGCYCSPALRCVQTAAAVLTGCKQVHIPIRVEPHLFEWLGWHTDQIPQFMSIKELKQAGYNIDIEYEPFTSIKCFNKAETRSQYYERTNKLMNKLHDTHKKKHNVVMLIVGHAATFAACSDAVLTKRPSGFLRMVTSCGDSMTMNKNDWSKSVSRVPNCALTMLEQLHSGKWQLAPCPIPSSSQNGVTFDWRQLMVS